MIELDEIRIGDPDAFRQLVERYKEKIINTCFGFLKNREDAEDASQEVFIEVYGAINDFRQEAKLSTWIYRIAVTKSLDAIRKKNRKKRFGTVKQVLGLDNPIDQLPDEKLLNPEQRVTADERSRVLQQAVDFLPESQKIAITLSKIEGFSNKEIAEIMDVSLSSVESLIHRAKKNLYGKLYHYYITEPY
jgi:RNA polymerase sigma-70 factor (ECF subfamily)